jgi:hypothetical protein
MMTSGQKKLLEICKKHIEYGEKQEAIEIIDAILTAEREAQRFFKTETV